MNRRTKKELKDLLSSDSPIDFYYWISLLNFFDDHKDELNLKELKKVVDKCEECRLYLNHENTDPISQEDVKPNVYEFYRLQIEYNKNNKDDDIELQFGLVERNQKIFA